MRRTLVLAIALSCACQSEPQGQRGTVTVKGEPACADYERQGKPLQGLLRYPVALKVYRQQQAGALWERIFFGRPDGNEPPTFTVEGGPFDVFWSYCSNRTTRGMTAEEEGSYECGGEIHYLEEPLVLTGPETLLEWKAGDDERCWKGPTPRVSSRIGGVPVCEDFVQEGVTMAGTLRYPVWVTATSGGGSAGMQVDARAGGEPPQILGADVDGDWEIVWSQCSNEAVATPVDAPPQPPAAPPRYICDTRNEYRRQTLNVKKGDATSRAVTWQPPPIGDCLSASEP